MVDTPTTTVPDTATLSSATSGDGTQLYVSLDGTTRTEVAQLAYDDGLTDLPRGERPTYETTPMDSADFAELHKNARRGGTQPATTGQLAKDAPKRKTRGGLNSN